jgi:hypothetical protein
MATLKDKYDLHLDTTLRNRVVASAMATANYFAEGGGSPSVEGLQLAKNITNGAINNYAQAFYNLLMVDSTIIAAGVPSDGTVTPAAITDFQVDSFVSAVWNKVAGNFQV